MFEKKNPFFLLQRDLNSSAKKIEIFFFVVKNWMEFIYIMFVESHLKFKLRMAILNKCYHFFFNFLLFCIMYGWNYLNDLFLDSIVLTSKKKIIF